MGIRAKRAWGRVVAIAATVLAGWATLTVAGATTRPAGPTADPAVVAWIRASAVPLRTVEAGNSLADMAPLRQVVGDARVVGLGEATHGTREHFQAKHRMLEFLVSEMGFTVFAIEASLPDCIAINDYVLHGKGDPEKAVAGQGFWTWSTEEVLDLVRWMRRYNENPARAVKLKFYGFDMQNERSAANAALDFLERAGDPAAGEFRKRLRPAFTLRFAAGEGTDEEAAGVDEALAALAGHFDANRARLVAATSADEFAVRRRCVDVARQAMEQAGEARSRASSLGFVRDMQLAMNAATYVKQLSEYVRAHLPDAAAASAGLLRELDGYDAFGQKYMNKATPEAQLREWDAQARAIADAIADAKDVPDPAAWREARQRADDLLDILQIFREQRAKPDEPPSVENVRDRCMAENVAWILEHEGPAAKVVLWAHNGHVMRARPQPGKAIMMQGDYLSRMLGKDYVAFGFAFDRGAFQAIAAGSAVARLGQGGLMEWTVGPAEPGSVDATLAAAGVPNFVLDLRTAPADGPVAAWVREVRPIRMVGAIFDPEWTPAQQYRPLAPADAFDALVFTAETTRARPLATLPYSSMDPSGRELSAAARPRLGVQIQQAGERVQIVAVIPGTPAAAAGLSAGDQILSVAGTPVSDMAGFRQALGKAPDGEVVELEIERDGKRSTLAVTFPGAPTTAPATRPA